MIEAKNLTRHHSTLAAIEDVSFKVEEEEILGFPEPDASGKTGAVRIFTAFARICGVSGASLAPWLKGETISVMPGAGGQAS